jgi:SagB-type dehydrogenase family enzyme
VKLPTGELRLELTLRPYPSAGALYELEIYLAVQHCDRISPGMYHYDPLDHQLTRVSADEQIVEELWTGAAGSAEIESRDIQVLLILAARFPRITWKYSTLAYSAILKHVGVLMESMYLTATAMNLAPCALGTGDSDVFTKAIGSDYYAETSVGEFLLGSCPDSSAASSP